MNQPQSDMYLLANKVANKVGIQPFPDLLEDHYQRHFLQAELPKIRTSTQFSFIIFGAFSIYDWLTFPHLWESLWPLRLAFLLVAAAVYFVSFSLLSAPWIHRMIFVTSLFCNAVVVEVGQVVAQSGGYSYQNGTAAVILGTCVFFQLPPRLLVVAVVMMIGNYLLVIGAGPLPTDVIATHLTLFVTIGGIGVYAAFRLETDRRQQYIHNLVLQGERERLTSAQAKLEQLSITDTLTGLNNRLYFDKQIKLDWQSCRRHQQWLSVILLDVDHFKSINDGFGHPVGDAALQHVADLMKQMAQRSTDYAVRYGGEEFLLVLPGIEPDELQAHADKLRQRIELTSLPDQPSLRFTASLGCASIKPTAKPAVERLIKEADTALYQAKNSGRNKVCQVIL
ncbi:hypothetical protein GCM10011369_03850 [Neiella marina]|uniref:diguanylate cyclase n=1 Tax=Neiella marina TaxID=508461 RepID=A0A8J2U276_9GAMM|nr:GGDEF domain-containing protein [Neiella marina]GGA65627.1 hypothetical protein GCM10011369_03850 [Neiella marina]